jgi:hypothetical protein
MKKLIFLLLILPCFVFSQNQKIYEEYVDGRLIKTLSQSEVQVTSSLRALGTDVGKYFLFDISVSNGSNKTRTFKVNDCKAYVVTVDEKKLNKGKIDKAYDIEEIEIMSSKDYQEIMKKKQKSRMFWSRLGAASAAEDAGRSTTSTSASINSNTYSSNNRNTDVNMYDSNGNKLGNATINQNSSGFSNSNANLASNTVNRDGAAVYNAMQNEERKLQDYYNQQQEARVKWNEAYLKSNTLSPYESCSGLLNIKFEKGNYLELHINVDELNFVFKWDPEDSEN